jgi:N-acetylneuraminic acid mutarotase
MSLDILNPLIIKRHKPKGGFCLANADHIDNIKYSPIYNDFGLVTDFWDHLSGYGPIRCNGSSVYNNNFYTFGGNSGVGGITTPISQAAVYNPNLNSWTMFAGDSVARMAHMVVYDSVSGNFMSFGGYTSSGVSNSVRSTPANAPSPTWNTSYTVMPANRYGHSGGIWNNKVYCWGGWASGYPGNSSSPFFNIAVYDISGNSWSTVASMSSHPIPLAATIDTTNGIMYQASWVSGDTTMSVWSCKLYSDTNQYIWTKLTSVTAGPALRYNHTLSYSNGVLYIIGGRLYNSPGTVVTEVWAYNIAYGTWIKLSMDNLKVGTEFASAEIINNKIYVIGGNLNGASSSDIVNAFHNYDLSKNYGMALRLMRV